MKKKRYKIEKFKDGTDVTFIIFDSEIEFDHIEESYDEEMQHKAICYRKGEVVYDGKMPSYSQRDLYEFTKKRLQELGKL